MTNELQKTRQAARSSEVMKARWQTPEWRARNLETHLGRKRPKETGEKISIKARQSWTPERRAERSALLKQIWALRKVQEETVEGVGGT